MMLKRSEFASTPEVDLSIFSGVANFQGYFPQWGDAAVADHNHFSWYALKAHTRNRAGTVELRSNDPTDTPLINFNYFDTGTRENAADELDLKALIQGVRQARQALRDYYEFGVLGGTRWVEERPGEAVQSDEEVGAYVKDQAWGHHASCSCPIGGEGDDMAVLDSRFRVRGVDGLRVVDASVFPEIPGVFIQSAVVMVGEKAADDIISGR